MTRRKKSVYRTPPTSVIFKGQRFILADSAEEDAPEEAPPKEEKKSTGSARVRIDECTGNGVTFELEAIVHSYDGVGIPGLDNADGGVSKRWFKVKRLRKLNDIPKETLKQIESDGSGAATIKRMEKYLRVKPSAPLYYIKARGGWNWSKKNGDREVAEIQRLLEFLRGRKALLYSFCSNKVDFGGGSGLI